MVGIGPGSVLDRSLRAIQSLNAATVVVGYTKYLKLIEDLTVDKKLISSGMTKESVRVKAALDEAALGQTVALISSGDPGVYGMAGLALEMNQNLKYDVQIEVVPGISAANTAAARLGAPLMLDYACISLSDLLVEWGMIVKRLEAAAEGDFVVALYNPRSHKRRMQLEEAVRILSAKRPLSTPVGIVTGIGLVSENIVHCTLGTLLEQEVGMRSTVVIGNSTTIFDGTWMITPRGYEIEGAGE